MKQQTLAMAADNGFEQFRRPTKRDVFLNTMDMIMPWQELCSVVNTPQELPLSSTPIEANTHPASSATPSDRIFTDAEIDQMEAEKQYHGDDPIVRAKLGLPSIETKRLISSK